MINPEKEIIELHDGVYARLHTGLTNAGFIIGDQEVLIIDSLRVPSFARELVQDIRTITKKPIKYVIDTHSHWDHSWGNEEFQDVTIIGHDNCYREMIDLEWNSNWRNRVVSAEASWSKEAAAVNITPPNVTFETSMRLYFGGKEIHILYLGKAHTSGDIFIHLPKEQIIFTGDVAHARGTPFLEDGYPHEWPGTDNRLLGLKAERFVSGHGAIGTYKDLTEARDFMHALVDNLIDAKQEGLNATDASKAATMALAPRFDEWRGFEGLEVAIPPFYNKLDGKKY
jgi:glyoxylase-like metal-dependent hydrolase (beta-lactamase superfamily II)